jgi:hypothetical protein
VGGDNGMSRAGAFLSTLCAFFLAEIGDKTQIATIGLAARFKAFYPVVIGTTLGMMLANIPAVLIGDRIAERFASEGHPHRRHRRLCGARRSHSSWDRRVKFNRPHSDGTQENQE